MYVLGLAVKFISSSSSSLFTVCFLKSFVYLRQGYINALFPILGKAEPLAALADSHMQFVVKLHLRSVVRQVKLIETRMCCRKGVCIIPMGSVNAEPLHTAHPLQHTEALQRNLGRTSNKLQE